MRIFITNTFKRTAKKLHRNQISILEKAISDIEQNPLSGELKKGDLKDIRVYKFYLSNQLILLAYFYDEIEQTITLFSFASHENFYENLKKQIQN